MYIRLKIFTKTKHLQILEQVDFPTNSSIIYSNGVYIKTCVCPELYFHGDGDIVFYLRGWKESAGLKCLWYGSTESLYRIFKALSSVAEVDIIWS